MYLKYFVFVRLSKRTLSVTCTIFYWQDVIKLLNNVYKFHYVRYKKTLSKRTSYNRCLSTIIQYKYFVDPCKWSIDTSHNIFYRSHVALYIKNAFQIDNVSSTVTSTVKYISNIYRPLFIMYAKSFHHLGKRTMHDTHLF